MGFDVAKLRFAVDSSELRKADQDLAKFGKTSKAVSGEALTLATAVRGLGAAAAALGAGAAFGAAIDRSAQLATAIGEVSTLIEGTPQEMALLTREVKALTGAYGGDLTTKANAFYQAISAGANGVADAAEVVAQANKLAIGGMTDVATGVDGLTTAMNVFAGDALTASEASDAMFVGMRAGKTTIAELAGSLGRVAPIARDVGLSFDEMVAAVAATTKGGINTNEAVSGLKAALANVIKPTAEAEEAAKRLGIQFDTAAVKSKGLAGFLEDVRDATGGNIDEMSALFGSVEGLAVVASLAGAGFEDLVDILGEMERKAGATDKAFEKVAETAPQRIDRALGQLKAATVGVGDFGLEAQATALEMLSGAVGAFAETVSRYDVTFQTAAENVQLFVDATGKSLAGAAAGIGDFVNFTRATLSGDWAIAWQSAVGVVDGAIGDMVFALPRFLDTLKDGVVDGVKGLGASIAAAIKGEVESTDILTGAQRIGMGMGTEIRNGLQEELSKGDIATGNWAQIGADSGAMYASGFSKEAVKAIQASGLVEAGFDMATGFEMANSNLVQIGDEAGQAGGDLDAATASANALAAALGVAATEAKVLSSYTDGTAPGTGNAGDGYSGVVGGGGLSSLGGRQSVSFSIYIPEERPLQEYFDFVDQGLKDIDREITRFARDNSGVISDAIMDGSADPRTFWQNFREMAIDSYGGILESLFSEGGAGSNAIGAGLEGILNKYVDRVNAQIAKYNSAVRNINVNDAIQRSPDGMSLTVDTNKFKDIETDWFNTSYELREALLRGALGGADGAKSFANLVAKYNVTRNVNINDSEVDNEPTTRKQWGYDENGDWRLIDVEVEGSGGGGKKSVTYSQKDVKKLDAVGKLFGNIVGNIQDKISLYASVIGSEVNGMGKIMERLEINLGKDGKAGGKLSKLIVAEFEDYSDKLAKRALKSRDDLKKAGESWTDALERLADDFLGVTQTMLLIGQDQLQRASLNNAKIASALAEQFGGVEEFGNAAMSYFNVAFSPSQQKGQLEDYVRGVLSEAGINRMPRTRQQYQNMVEGIDLSTKRGQEKYAVLLSMADLFDQILPAWESGETAINGAADAQERYNRTLTRVSGQLSGMISEAESASQRYKAVANSLRGTADELRSMGRTSEQNLEALRFEYSQTLAKASSGDVDAMERLGGVATDYADASKKNFSTAAEWRFFNTRMAAQLDKVADTAKEKQKLSKFEERSLKRLLDAVENGRLTNRLITKTNTAVGGLPDRLVNRLARLLKETTGKDLDLKKKKPKQVDANQRDFTGDEEGVNKTPAPKKTGGKSDVDELRLENRKLMRKQTRTIRRGNRYNKTTAKILKDFDANGLPAERV